MSEPKFTKGPWKNVKTHSYCNYGVMEHYYDVYEIKDANNKIITKLDAVGMEKDKNIKANAALIACSPEMYWMLEKCRTALHDCGMSCLSEDVFLLLKKARGEQ